MEEQPAQEEINQTPEIPQEQISVLKNNKKLIIVLVIIGVLIAGYFVSAKFYFNTWPFETILTESLRSLEDSQSLLSECTPSNDELFYTIVAGGNIDAYFLRVSNKNGLRTGLSNEYWGEFPVIHEQIPNSSFSVFGERYYITLDTREEYLVEIIGKASGNFNLAIIKGLSGDSDAPTFLFPNTPINSNSRIWLIVNCGLETTPELFVDLDWDGDVSQEQKNDMLTYRNEEFGFEIVNSQEWNIFERSGDIHIRKKSIVKDIYIESTNYQSRVASIREGQKRKHGRNC